MSMYSNLNSSFYCTMIKIPSSEICSPHTFDPDSIWGSTNKVNYSAKAAHVVSCTKLLKKSISGEEWPCSAVSKTGTHPWCQIFQKAKQHFGGISSEATNDHLHKCKWFPSLLSFLSKFHFTFMVPVKFENKCKQHNPFQNASHLFILKHKSLPGIHFCILLLDAFQERKKKKKKKARLYNDSRISYNLRTWTQK